MIQEEFISNEPTSPRNKHVRDVVFPFLHENCEYGYLFVPMCNANANNKSMLVVEHNPYEDPEMIDTEFWATIIAIIENYTKSIPNKYLKNHKQQAKILAKYLLNDLKME